MFLHASAVAHCKLMHQVWAIGCPRHGRGRSRGPLVIAFLTPSSPCGFLLAPHGVCCSIPRALQAQLLVFLRASLIARLVKNLPSLHPSWIPGVGKICWRRDRVPTSVFLNFLCGSFGKESACNAGDLGSVPGLGRSPVEGEGYPLQYSGLENSMGSQRVGHDRVTFTFHVHYY